MGNRKQPNPPPAGAVKPDPPPAPPLPVGRYFGTVLPGVEVRVPMPKVKPPREDVFARLDSFRDLAAGWDSYGAQPIDPRAIAAAQALLHSLTVVPTARGGVQIEAGDVEVEIAPDGRIVEDAPAARPWTFCSERLPQEAGRYEVAHLVGDEIRRAYALWGAPRDMPPSWCLPGYWWAHGVYAWRPIAEDPPPLRPQDRDYLIANNVPAEWLTEPKGD